MVHSMIEKVIFYLEEQWYKSCLAEAAEAVRSYAQYGFGTDLLVTEAGEGIPEYVLMEPQWVDRDSLVKIWQRQRHLPWTILETERSVVREFVPEDLEAIYELYDDEARRYLEAPSEDLDKERKILTAYIDRVYPLCGYGHWAVLDRGSGKLIGRIGFSFPKSSAPGPVPDASFGYLLHRQHRGRGLAREVCAALLDYGFAQLGFETVGADAESSNAASVKILQSFGFTEVAREKEQRYYILHKTNWRNNNHDQ